MAIERVYRGNGRHYVVTERCGLCGETMGDQQKFANHLSYHCKPVLAWRRANQLGETHIKAIVPGGIHNGSHVNGRHP